MERQVLPIVGAPPGYFTHFQLLGYVSSGPMVGSIVDPLANAGKEMTPDCQSRVADAVAALSREARGEL